MTNYMGTVSRLAWELTNAKNERNLTVGRLNDDAEKGFYSREEYVHEAIYIEADAKFSEIMVTTQLFHSDGTIGNKFKGNTENSLYKYNNMSVQEFKASRNDFLADYAAWAFEYATIENDSNGTKFARDQYGEDFDELEKEE